MLEPAGHVGDPHRSSLQHEQRIRDIIQRPTVRFFSTHTNGMRIEAAESRMVNGGIRLKVR